MSDRPSPRASRKPMFGLLLLAACSSLFAVPSANAASLPTMTLALTSSSIGVGGTLQSGGVNVVTTATGTKESAAVLVRLNPGVSAAELDGYLNSDKAGMDPNTASKFGAIVFDTEAPAGKSEAQTELAPGSYVAINAEGEKSSKWPRTSFIITAATAPVALPAAQATMRTIDFGFRGPATLRVGELVRFENEGYVVHMNIGFPVKSKKAATQLAKDFLTGKEKQGQKLVSGPPANFAGPLSTGGLQQETITAAPGWYVMTCFMDTQDGRQHTLLGMERVIKIVK